MAEEIASLIQNCMEDGSSIGIRDATVISILFGAGLRREEITKLNLDDYKPEDASAWLELHGKDAGPLFVPVSGAILMRCV